MRAARKIAAPLALCLATTGAPFAEAQDAPPAERPRIGLVLGGGGAKGGAHVGVLQVLDELRVPVDCVAGTSMGALIGAIFASGTAPDQVEQLVTDINWGETVGGLDSRNRMPIERKLAERPYSNTLEFGISDGHFRTPSGLIATQNIEDKIRTLVSATRHNDSFDDLPLPYRAVATDIVDSKMVVLDRGDLSVAMRASMAIPGVFSPVVYGDDVLVDGGVMRNIPVDVARELCADVVIAVWFPEPDPGPMDNLSPVGAMYRAISASIISNERTQLDSLTVADVNLPVPVGDIGTSQFQRVPESIELGRQAANAARASLQRYALSEAEFRAWRAAVTAPEQLTNMLAEVRVTGTDRVNAAYLESQLNQAVPGATASSTLIAAEAEALYALGDFDRVDYSLSGPASARVLEFRPVEKPWGPDFVQFDLGLASTGGNQIFAILRADHTRTWINSLGGRWHNALQLGRQTLVETDLYQPLDTEQTFFLQPMLAYEHYIEDLFYESDRLADYKFRKWYGQVDVGVNLGTRAQGRMGLRYGDTRATLRTGIPGLPETDWETDTRTHLQFIYDTRDVVGLPTHGVFVNLRYLDSHSWLGGEQDYRIAEGVVAPAFNVRGNSLSLIVGGGTLLSGESPVSEQIELGGIRTFPGLRPGELRGTEYWFAGTSYLWRVSDLQPVFGQAIYGGVRLQAGQMHDDNVTLGYGTLYSISGSLAGRTPLGPFQLSLAYVIDEAIRFQFSIGRPVDEGSILDTLH